MPEHDRWYPDTAYDEKRKPVTSFRQLTLFEHPDHSKWASGEVKLHEQPYTYYNENSDDEGGK